MNFSNILNSNIERGLRKQLLHSLIDEITIDQRREIESIKLKISDSLIMLIQNNDGTPIEGVSSFLMWRDLGISNLELELVI